MTTNKPEATRHVSSEELQSQADAADVGMGEPDVVGTEDDLPGFEGTDETDENDSDKVA